MVIAGEPKTDVEIPGEKTAFGTLIQAQAAGDFQSLDAHNCRAIFINGGSDPEAAVEWLANSVAGL